MNRFVKTRLINYDTGRKTQNQINMNPIELIKKDLQNKKDTFGRPMIDTIVVLKKDDKGYYIEYAFKEGAPHDNRCLSWYDSYQPEAYRRNGWFKNLSEEDTKKSLDVIREEREKKIGKIYRLSSFSCGFEEDEKNQLIDSEKSWNEFHKDEPFIPEEHVCKVGCPAKVCQWVKNRVLPWSQENPVKCACWLLKDGKTMEDYIKDYKISMPATELAELL